MYHIRLDTSGDNPFVQWLTDNCKSILVSEETTKKKNVKNKNLHLHVVVDTDIPEQTIRNRIRKQGFVGNASYSISQVRDLIKCLAYVQKDSKIIVNTIPSELFQQAVEYDLQVKEDISKNKRSNIMQGIEEYALSKKFDINTMSLYNWSRLTVEYYKKEGILFREFQIVSQVQTLYLKYNPEAIGVLTDRICDRIKK